MAMIQSDDPVEHAKAWVERDKTDPYGNEYVASILSALLARLEKAEQHHKVCLGARYCGAANEADARSAQ